MDIGQDKEQAINKQTSKKIMDKGTLQIINAWNLHFD